MNLTDFPPLIRTRRESLGWTQVQLAAGAGTEGNTVARIERGERLPRWDLAVALIEAMGGLSVRGWSPVAGGPCRRCGVVSDLESTGRDGCPNCEVA